MSNYNEPGQYPYQAPNTDYPGKALGIVAMVLSLINLIGFPTALFGLIMGYVALGQSKAAGYGNTSAKVAVISGWIIVGISFLIFALLIVTWLGVASVGQSVDVTPNIVPAR